MKTKITHYLLLGLIAVSSFLAWFSVYRAIKVADSSTWAVPIALFVIYAISLCLAAVLVKSEVQIAAVAALSFFFSFVFAMRAWHLILIILCIFILLSAIRSIRRDLELNIKVNIRKSLAAGKSKIVFALAIMIASQYFFIIKNMDGQKNMPKFDISAVSSKLVVPVLDFVNPNFKKIEQEGITVDQFIIEQQKQNSEKMDIEQIVEEQIPQNLPPKQREQLKRQAITQISQENAQLQEKNSELVLGQGRQQLSEMVGHEIKGDEKISNVFAGFIDKRINDFFQYKLSDETKPAVLEYVFTAVLFLTVWPLGSILCTLSFSFAVLIFKILKYSGLVKIGTVSAEREVIE